jgi:hypothetical protein
LAEITTILPEKNPLLAKALLFHTAQPVWDMEGIDEGVLNSAHRLYGRGLTNAADGMFSTPSKVTFVRTGTLNRRTREKISIVMPDILANQKGSHISLVQVSVTCISAPPVDINKGTEYLGAFVQTSLYKAMPGKNLSHVPPDFKESHTKWDICQYISKPFYRFKSGDWQIWLELLGRWDKKEVDVPYALVVTIEDVSHSLDIYSAIEVLNRYRPINEIRVRAMA